MAHSKASPQFERRALGTIEFRAATKADSVGVLAGYAAVFNRDSEYMGFIERIAPGAFSGTLVDDVRALWSHEEETVLGRTRAGTLRLAEDSVGLSFEIDLPDTQCGRDAAVSVRRGDVSGMSFGFEALEDQWTFDADPAVRTLKRLRLFEISPVAFPAYPDASVALRSLSAAKAAVAPAPCGAKPEETRAASSLIRARMAGRLIVSA